MDIIDYKDTVDYLAALRVLRRRGKGLNEGKPHCSCNAEIKMLSWMTGMNVDDIEEDIEFAVERMDSGVGRLGSGWLKDFIAHKRPPSREA